MKKNFYGFSGVHKNFLPTPKKYRVKRHIVSKALMKHNATVNFQINSSSQTRSFDKTFLNIDRGCGFSSFGFPHAVCGLWVHTPKVPKHTKKYQTIISQSIITRERQIAFSEKTSTL